MGRRELSGACDGTAVREELSDENMLEPRVAEETEE